MIDVDAVRSETPGCEASAFLLSAGSSLPSRSTLDAVVGHLGREALVGGYEAADEVVELLARGRADLATLVGGRADEIALQVSDTQAWVKAWWGWVAGGNVAPGQRVWVDRMSYHSHYTALAQTRRLVPFEIAVLPSLADGTVDVDAMRLDATASAVCVTMVGTHSGNVNPVTTIGAACAEAGVPMFVDGCQALGHLGIDVRGMGASVLTATGRKFLRGPRGTGMLWVASELVERFEPPGLDGTSTSWSDEGGLSVDAGTGRFEEYEVSFASMVGLATAAREAIELGMEDIERRAVALGERLRTSLASIDGVTVHDTAARRSAIVTFSVAGSTAGAVVSEAARAGVRINESSATWAALDMGAKGLDRIVRASPHYFNTDDDLDRLVDVVQRCVHRDGHAARDRA